ncbi:hypothetical protein SAMN05660199_02431 [Klenkia soli]|uniref:DUF559 domain-containing protein n=1 Tax=Klenkia soli TaxID=1052260 RepID=A0A1H0LV78_9ACTN|nr:hypothetical protein [Klenkia soli]SDO72092.1 hypothetical protein SAMN05660199_02431 [Klenkia soli]
MDVPRVLTAAQATAGGAGRGRRQGADWLHLAHDRWVQLADALDGRERLALLAQGLPDDAAFSHLTAAHVLGAHVAMPARPTVALTPRRVLPQRAEVVTRIRTLTAEDVVVRDGLRVTSGPQTFLDCAAIMSADELCAVGDALLRAGAMTDEELSARLARGGRARGVVRARTVAPHLDGRAMSRPESQVRWWLLDSDLPPVELQVPVRDRRGAVVAHADLGWEEWRVLGEYEGRQHAEPDQFDRDVDRYSLMAADGYLLLRFANRHRNARTVVDRSRRALLSRGWRPPRQV